MTTRDEAPFARGTSTARSGGRYLTTEGKGVIGLEGMCGAIDGPADGVSYNTGGT